MLDTVTDEKADFVKRRPIVPAGQKYVDPDFDKQTALGKHAADTDWKRPEVSGRFDWLNEVYCAVLSHNSDIFHRTYTRM